MTDPLDGLLEEQPEVLADPLDGLIEEVAQPAVGMGDLRALPGPTARTPPTIKPPSPLAPFLGREEEPLSLLGSETVSDADLPGRAKSAVGSFVQGAARLGKGVTTDMSRLSSAINSGIFEALPLPGGIKKENRRQQSELEQARKSFDKIVFDPAKDMGSAMVNPDYWAINAIANTAPDMIAALATAGFGPAAEGASKLPLAKGLVNKLGNYLVERLPQIVAQTATTFPSVVSSEADEYMQYNPKATRVEAVGKAAVSSVAQSILEGLVNVPIIDKMRAAKSAVQQLTGLFLSAGMEGAEEVAQRLTSQALLPAGSNRRLTVQELWENFRGGFVAGGVFGAAAHATGQGNGQPAAPPAAASIPNTQSTQDMIRETARQRAQEPPPLPGSDDAEIAALQQHVASLPPGSDRANEAQKILDQAIAEQAAPEQAPTFPDDSADLPSVETVTGPSPIADAVPVPIGETTAQPEMGKVVPADRRQEAQPIEQDQRTVQDRRAPGRPVIRSMEDLDALDNEGLKKTILIEPMTGLGSKLAEEIAPRPKVQGQIDIDGLGAVNDKLGGHTSGNAYIEYIVGGLVHGGFTSEDAFRTGGDEFTIHGNGTQAELQAKVDKANEYFQQNPTVITTADGERITFKGGVSHGIGETFGEADRKLYENKLQREASGLRSRKGDLPPGLSRSTSKLPGNRDQREVLPEPKLQAREVEKEAGPDLTKGPAWDDVRATRSIKKEEMASIAPAEKPKKNALVARMEAKAKAAKIPEGADKNRQDGWRTNLFKARDVAKGLGVSTQGKKLQTLLEDIDRAETEKKAEHVEPKTDVPEAKFGNIKEVKEGDHFTHNGREYSFAVVHDSVRTRDLTMRGGPPISRNWGTIAEFEAQTGIKVVGQEPAPPAPKAKPTREELLAKMREKNGGQPAPVPPAPRPTPAPNPNRVTFQGFQGKGASLEDVYGPDAVKEGRAVPVLGPGDYVATTRTDAEYFGKTNPKTITLENPFILDSNKKWMDILESAGAQGLHSGSREFYTNPQQVPKLAIKLQEFLKSQGYDGVVVRSTESEKRLAETFGHDQAVKFGQPPAPPTAAPRAVTPTKQAATDAKANLEAKKAAFIAAVKKAGDGGTAFSGGPLSSEVLEAGADLLMALVDVGYANFKVMAEEMKDALTSPALRKSFELAYDSYRELDDSIEPRGQDTMDSLFPPAAVTPPSTAPASAFEIVKNWHHKDQRDNWAVKMLTRVPRERYDELKALAKRHGGTYSNYEQFGAVPGFQFKTEAQAKAFLAAAEPQGGGQNVGSVTEAGVLPDEAGAGTPAGAPPKGGAGGGVVVGGGGGGTVPTVPGPAKPGRGGSGNGVLPNVDSGAGGGGYGQPGAEAGIPPVPVGNQPDYVGNREPDAGGVVRGLESGLNYDVRSGGLNTENLSSEGGKKRAAQNNVNAIQIVKALKAEGRQATPEEQQALAKYVGWGALDKAVDAWRARQAETIPEDQKDDSQKKWEKDWLPLHKQLVAVLTPAELRQARASIRNAHFTSQEVIGGAWSALAGMGITKGNALEPSGGIGNFIGLAPQGLKWGAVELDGITAEILAGLYPQAAVASTGFQNIVPHAQQDLVISNFPFDNNVKLDYKGERFSLHDFFFLQGLEHLKPGGVLVGITSHYTLDKLNPRVRTLLDQQAEFLGAIRLPNNAFSKNAGTQVVTDLIFLQKKGEGVQARDFEWGKTKPVTVKTRKGDDVQVEVNQYFHDHPAMVLGTYGAGGLESMDQLTINPFEDHGSLESQIKDAVKAFPKRVLPEGYELGASPVSLDVRPGLQNAAFAGQKGDKSGSIKTKDGRVGLLTPDGALAPLPIGTRVKNGKTEHIFLDTLTKTQEHDLANFHAVRDIYAELITKEKQDVPDEDLADLRSKLNEAYDKLVKPRKWGTGGNAITAPLHLTREVKRVAHPLAWLKGDVDFYSVASLEVGKDENITKAPIFSQRVLRPSAEPADMSLPDAASGYSASLAWRGRVDLPWMSLKTGMSVSGLEETLATERLAFRDPATGEIEPGHRYLSGNVRKKLAQAEAMGLVENTLALKAVQPDRRAWGEFSASVLSPWVPDSLVSKFLKDRLGINGIESHLDSFGKRTFPHLDANTIKTRRIYNPKTSNREFEILGEFDGYSVGVRFNKILEATFNGNRLIIKNYDDEGNVIGVNTAATEFAQARQKALEDAFDQWTNVNSSALEDSYNENVNHSRNAEWPVPNMDRYPGASQVIMLEDFQKRFVERSMEVNALAAHVVGSGKTFSMVTSAMEAKRRGLARKPVLTTLNEAVGTVVAQAKTLYPGATIMYLPDNPTADQRRIFAHQVRTRDVDLVVMPMSAFNMIGDSKENVEALILKMEEELEDTLRGITDARTKKRTQKRTQAAIDKLRDNLLDQSKRAVDKGMPIWDDFGFDWLMVDEAHKYKKLGFTTTKQGIKGIDTGRSQRAFSLFVKTRSVTNSQGANRGVIFATGTPVSNTMAELWTIARFLDPDGLDDFGIRTFDEFVGTFSSIEARDVYTATQEYKTYDMLGKFKNGPEFMTWFSRFSDRVGADQIKRSSLPKMIGGGREIVDVDPTPNTQTIVGDLAERLKEWYDLPPKERAENSAVPMVIEGLAVNAAIDPRLVNPTLPPEPDTKLAKMIQEAYSLWKDPKLKADKAVTVIFLDRFRSPDPDTSEEGAQYKGVPRFNAHHEIRDRLIELGVPKDQIYLFTDGTKVQNREAMDRINAGEVRIALGTTEKGGTGLNIQERLYALIHGDLPYNAAGITQREGRQIRSGNMFQLVRTISYGTKKTLDAKKAESIFHKVKFFDQFMFSKDVMAPQEFEDIGTDDSMSYNDMVGAFSGDPRVIRKTALDRELKDLERQRRGHMMVLAKARAEHAYLEAKLAADGARMDRFEAAANTALPVLDAVEQMQEDNSEYSSAQAEAKQKGEEQPKFTGEVLPTTDMRPEESKAFYKKANDAISSPWEWNGIWGREAGEYEPASTKAFPVQKVKLGDGLVFEGEQVYTRSKNMVGQAIIESQLGWTVRAEDGTIALSGDTRWSTWDAILTAIRKEAADTRDAPIRIAREMDNDKKAFAGLTRTIEAPEFKHQAELDRKAEEYRVLMAELLGTGLLKEGGDEITHGTVMDDSEASDTSREDDDSGGMAADMLGGQQIYEKAISMLGLGPDATIGEIKDAVLAKIGKLGSTVKMTAVKILNRLKALGKVFAQKVAEFLHEVQPFQGRKGEIGAIGKNVIMAMKLDRQQVESLKHTGLVVDQRPVADRIRGWKSAIRKELTVQKVVDQFASIAKLDRHAYLLARMSKGTEGAMEALMHFGNLFLRGGVTDTKVKGGKGFIGVMQELQGEHDVFLAWVAANRAEGLTEEGRENLFRDQDIASLKRLNQGKMPDGSSRRVAYYKALAEMNAIGKSVLDVSEASGTIDPISREIWEKQFYVPFYRAIEDGVSGPNIGAGGGLVSQYAFKRLKGGEDKLNQDLMYNVMMNWSHLLSSAAKNRAAAASLRAADRTGVAERVNGPGKDVVWHLGFKTEVIPAGKVYIESGIEKVSDGTALIKTHGRIYYRVDDPQVLESVMALESSPLRGKFLDIATKTKRVLTIGVTASPLFKVRNLMRDSVATVAISGISLNVAKNVAQGGVAMAKKSGQTYGSILASGAIIRFGTMLEGNSSKHLQRLIDSGVDKNTVVSSWEHVVDVAQKSLDFYNELGDISEGANRAALYTQMMAQGATHAEAAFAARDLLDFTMGGTSGAVRFLTQTVPFLNARIQGTYRLQKGARQNPARFASVIGALSLASIFLMLKYKDDDDWKKREDWDRDNYWWFKVGGIAYRIPKPFEVGAIGTLAERSVELFVSDEMTRARFLDRILAMLGSTFALNPVPQVAKPLLDVYANKDPFRGRPIESAGMEFRKTADRFSMSTSEVGKFAGKAGVLSPVQIDYLVNGYFGWLGSAVLTATNEMIRPFSEDGQRPARKLSDLLLVGGFAEQLPSRNNRYATSFYEQAREIESAYGSWRFQQKQAGVDLGHIKKKNLPEIAKQAKSISRYKRELQDISERSLMVTLDPAMSADQKRREIDALDHERNELLKAATAALKLP